jgi:hypothetical protein
MPVWLEEADDVFFAQGANVRREYAIASPVIRQDVKGEDLDGIFGLCYEVSL